MVSFIKMALIVVGLVEFLCLLRVSFASLGRHEDVPKSTVNLKVGRTAAQEKPTTPPHKAELVPSICGDMALDVDGIQVHVLCWKRQHSLFALLEQLRVSNYKNWGNKVPLYMHVAAGADPLVLHVARSVAWPHGPVYADIRDQVEKGSYGTDIWMTSVTRAARDAGPNTLIVVFEDDMRVSGMYFQYLLRMIREYGKNPECRDQSLMGFSLSPVRLLEMQAGSAFVRWRANVSIPADKGWNTYLSTLPSSWGGAYWSDRWLEFADFAEVRAGEPYFHGKAGSVHGDFTPSSQEERDEAARQSPSALFVPGSSSNLWTGSWKRFLVDFMYGCGLLMMYPHLEGENGLATTLAIRSTAGQVSDTRIKVPNSSLWMRVPRVAPLLRPEMEAINALELSDFSSLQVVDLWLQLSSQEQVLKTGAEFVFRIAANPEFRELGNTWCSAARMQGLAGVSSSAPPQQANSLFLHGIDQGDSDIMEIEDVESEAEEDVDIASDVPMPMKLLLRLTSIQQPHRYSDLTLDKMLDHAD